MENKQDLVAQTPQWIAAWSQYLLQQFSTDQHQLDQARLLIEEVLEASLQGDSCITQHDQNIQSLGPLALSELALSEDRAKNQVAPFVYDEHYLYLYRYWKLEQRLATQVIRLKQQHIQPIEISPFDDLLTDIYQKAALDRVAKHAFNIITGGPGTGKTYTLARMIAVLHQAIPNIRIAMAAPTGKAAQRMGEALQKSLLDPKLQKFGLRLDQFNPITIHRLLGLGHQQLPRFNQRQPLPYDVIVVDEASMLDLNLATLLFEAVPDHCRLILLGDANQLASVDVGSVLADLQQVPSLQENRSHLLNSQRFKGDALIGKMAQFIQAQKQSDIDQTTLLSRFENEVVQAFELKPIILQKDMQDIIQLEYLPEDIPQADLASYYQKLSWGFQQYFQSLKEYLNAENPNDHIDLVTQAFDQYRILSAVRHGAFGLNTLNLEMEKALFDAVPNLYRQADWYVGRPVMMTYNDYQLGLSNGDIGICFKRRQQAEQFEVFFPSLNKWISATRLPKAIQTAFVLTIHKSQGSEFTHTAVVLDKAATKLLSQELIYTAITRAKSVVSLLVDQNAFRQSLSIAIIRMSGLVSKINQND